MREYFRRSSVSVLGGFLILIFFLGDARAQDPEPEPLLASVTAGATATPEDLDLKILKKLTLEQKVGQLFIFGFMGTSIDHSLTELIKNLKPGGLVVFSRNIKTAKQTADLLYSAQVASVSSSKIPLLVAVDQEGGDVIRIKTSPSLPSALALGATGQNDLVHEAGLQTAHILKSLGFNMDLAPVLDISDPLKDTFIGTRSFGKNAQIVSQFGLQFADGLRDGGVLPTAKHFPGHGGIRTDSHVSAPQKNVGLDFLLEHDLVPFGDMAKQKGPNAIMVAHIIFPKIDASLTPATYSKTIIGDILRTKLGFDGVVMTDDIEMGGASSIASPVDRAVHAINAGVDLVMLAWNRKLQHKVVRGVIQAVRSGKIDIARVDESVLRLLKVKRQFAGFSSPTRPDPRTFLSVIRSDGLRSVAQKTLRTLFDQYKDADLHLSGDNAPSKVYIYALNASFYNSFKATAPAIKSQPMSLSDASPARIAKILLANPTSLAIIYVSGTKSAHIVNHLDADVAQRCLIVNTETQSFIKEPARFAKVLDVYFKHPELGKFTAEFLQNQIAGTTAPAKAATTDSDDKNRAPSADK